MRYEPKLLITNVTPTSVFIEVRLWIRDIQERDLIRSEIMTALLNRLRPAGVRPPPSTAPRPDQMLESVKRLEGEVKELRERLDSIKELEEPPQAR
jgi:small-conductance mechanosensitive channel